MSEMGWEKGIICTDSGDVIARPGMSLEELLATSLGATAKVEGQSPTHKRVVLGPMLISGYECHAAEYFARGVLAKLHIVVSENTARRFSFVTGFASPPNGPEVAFLEEWIAREIGKKPPAEFPWGRIGGVYDGIGGFARILFQFT